LSTGDHCKLMCST